MEGGPRLIDSEIERDLAIGQRNRIERKKPVDALPIVCVVRANHTGQREWMIGRLAMGDGKSRPRGSERAVHAGLHAFHVFLEANEIEAGRALNARNVARTAR